MSVQETLQDEHTKIARVENAVTRVVGKEIYQVECIPVGSTSSICEKDRWDTHVMY